MGVQSAEQSVRRNQHFNSASVSVAFAAQVPFYHVHRRTTHQSTKTKENSSTLTRNRLRILVVEEHIRTIFFARQERL